MVTRIKNLDEAVCILNSANTLEKDLRSNFLPLEMGKL